jgi:acyl-coenzyme A thioesterase PaaI-like protein
MEAVPDPADLARVAAQLPPYAKSVGMSIDGIDGGVPILKLEFGDKVLGRPGFLHGGAIGGLLEMAAFTALRSALEDGAAPLRFKPVNVTVEFLRGGTEQPTYASARVTRAGRRIANLTAEAWQDDRTKPIAVAWLNVLLRER